MASPLEGEDAVERIPSTPERLPSTPGRIGSGPGRTVSAGLVRTTSAIVHRMMSPGPRDDDDDEEDSAVASRRQSRATRENARAGWQHLREAVHTAAAFQKAGQEREAENMRRIDEALRPSRSFDPDADVMIDWVSRSKILGFELIHLCATAVIHRLWHQPSNVLCTRLVASLMEYRRLGVPMPEGGGLLSTVRDIALGFAGGHGGGLRVVCDLYAGFVPRMLADSFLMPLVNPETWFEVLQHIDYLQTGVVHRDVALEWAQVLDSPMGQMSLRLALCLPRIACEMAYTRAVLGDPVPSAASLSFGAITGGLWYGVCGLPWDLFGRVVVDIVDPLGDLGGVEMSTVMGHFLSDTHTLADRRSFWERYAATPTLIFWGMGFSTGIVAFARDNLYDLMAEFGLEEFDFGGSMLGWPWWVEAGLGFTPYPDLTFGDSVWSMLHMLPFTLPLGIVVGYPVEWLYHRLVYRPLKRYLFEDDENHMHRKLRHARRHTHDLHGIITPSNSLTQTGGEGEDGVSAPDELAAAAESLEYKTEALLERCEELLDTHQIRYGGSVQSQLDVTINRAKGLGPILHEFATVSPSALLSGDIEVKFEGELGMDMGGLTRDFFEDVLSTYINDPTTGLFAAAPDGGLLPKKGGSAETEGVRLFALGRLIALAVTAGIPLSVRFSRALYKVLLGEEITADEVARIDPHFAKHRIATLLEPGGVDMLEEILCEELTFVSVPGDEARGEVPHKQVDLVDGGSQIRVTESTKVAYVQLLVEHYLVGYCRAELAYLVEGFYDVLPRNVLRGDGFFALTAVELELIVTGLPEIDVEQWREYTTGDLDDPENEEYAEWFWEIVESMSDQERAMLLSFACGAGRLPGGGFAALHPHFSVEVNHNEDAAHHPSAHTCFNQLCLPGTYTSKDELRQKLLVSIKEGKGFGFM